METRTRTERRQHRQRWLSALAILSLAHAAHAADHREAPLASEDPTADIADVYAFVSPSDASKLVLALTVNPFAVSVEAGSYNFSPNVRYDFNIDRDLDGDADRRITFRFDETAPDGSQSFSARFPHRIRVTGLTTQPTLEPTPNAPVIAQHPEGIQVFAGPRDDPFFFDFVGVSRFLAGTGGPDGTDSFAGFNVSAIVVEVPLDVIDCQDAPFAVWGTTSRRLITLRRDVEGTPNPGVPFIADFGRFEQVERMGNPGVATVLIPPGLKDLFNVTKPRADAENWAPTLVASLQALGTSDANIGILASVAVPDTLKVDPTQATSFPNGRGLADDVIDVLLGLITNGAVPGDGVAGNDVPFASEFPFLAAPQQAP